MKILIVVPSFHNGGTITSLRNILTQLDLSKFEIDIFAITNTGPSRKYLEKYVNILGIALDKVIKERSITNSLKSALFKFVKLAKKVLCKLGIDISPIVFKSVVTRLEKNNYNLVIGFQEGQPTKFISYFKKAKKIAWVHSDYSNMLKISKLKPQNSLFMKIDKIVCVSHYTKNVFVDLIPETKYKTISLHNLIDSDFIKKRSIDLKDFDPLFKYSGFKIVSLGRIDPVKRFSSIPKIVYDLKNKGLSFRWYIIGGGNGPEKELLKKNISEYSVQGELSLLGEKNNPYPYIKEADLLVSTSFSEACPNVINEAKILGTPIVSTDFGSVYEFIEDNVNGLISPIENIAVKIEQMISNETVYNRIKNNISQFKYSNVEILDVLYKEILVSEK